MKQLVAIGGSMHGRIIEIDDRFGPGDAVCFAIVNQAPTDAPPKLQDLPETPAEAYRIGAIEFEPGRAIEYLIETRLSGEFALCAMLNDVAELATLKAGAAEVEEARRRYA